MRGFGFWTAALAILLAPVATLPAQRITLQLATADTAPLSRPDGTGYYDRLLTRALSSIDITAEIIALPSERSLVEANAGRVDGEFARTEDAAALYPNLVIVPEPLNAYEFVAITRNQTEPPTSFAALADLHVGFITGWKIYETSVTAARSVTNVSNEAQLFALLTAGRVDTILYNRVRAMAWLARNRDAGLRIADVPMATRPMHLLLHQRHAPLVPTISAAIARQHASGYAEAQYREAYGR